MDIVGGKKEKRREGFLFFSYKKGHTYMRHLAGSPNTREVGNPDLVKVGGTVLNCPENYCLPMHKRIVFFSFYYLGALEPGDERNYYSNWLFSSFTYIAIGEAFLGLLTVCLKMMPLDLGF